MPLFQHAPWQADLRRARDQNNAQPWAERAVPPVQMPPMAPTSPWMPAQPNYAVPGQVWNPEQFMNGPKPKEIDEHGNYRGGWGPGLDALWFKSAPPQNYDPAADFNRELADALMDMK